jgi:hypothetical protein
MDRKTTKIKTPISGQEVEINEWLTGAEAEYVDQPVAEAFAEARMKILMDKPVDMKNSSAVDNRRTIEKFVVSIDGTKENILDRTSSWNEVDYMFVVNQCNAIREDFKKKAVMSTVSISPKSAS